MDKQLTKLRDLEYCLTFLEKALDRCHAVFLNISLS